MGGLRAGNTPMRAENKDYIRSAWTRVGEATGQPFDLSFLDRESFTYDTEPACRAVVTARRLLPPGAAVHGAHQRAFYAENRDMTSADEIAAVAEEAGFDRGQFSAAFAAPETHNETFRDFLTAQELGIRGFPTLIAGSEAKGYALLTNGYRPLDDLPDPLERWLAAGAPVTAAALTRDPAMRPSLEPYRSWPSTRRTPVREQDARRQRRAPLRVFGRAGAGRRRVRLHGASAVAHWGRAFLDGGSLRALPEAGLRRRGGHGRRAEADDGLDIEVTSRGELCATGHAAMTRTTLPRSMPSRGGRSHGRAPADEETAAGPPPRHPAARHHAGGRRATSGRARDRPALSAAEGLSHPGLLPRLFNWALTHNVVLGPWIHVGSTADTSRRRASATS